MRKVLKFSMIIYGAIGLIIGIGIFIYSIFDGSVPFNFGNYKIYGIWSGIISIFFVPIIMGTVGFLHGLMFWFPIVYIYKKLTNKKDTNEST